MDIRPETTVPGLFYWKLLQGVYNVFKLAKELYNLRSALVHGNSNNSITEEKVWLAYDLAMAVYREITHIPKYAARRTNQHLPT